MHMHIEAKYSANKLTSSRVIVLFSVDFFTFCTTITREPLNQI